jgi:hypothetical protein
MKAKIWFTCAAMFDPVCPKLLTACAITWEAKYREIDLVIERPLKGNELVKKMKGWITVDPEKVINIVENYGKFKINEHGELYVELTDEDCFENLKAELNKHFKDQILFEKFDI